MFSVQKGRFNDAGGKYGFNNHCLEEMGKVVKDLHLRRPVKPEDDEDEITMLKCFGKENFDVRIGAPEFEAIQKDSSVNCCGHFATESQEKGRRKRYC
ncbi:hypothetical protein EVAR_99846_1 [Eumeta japonica]|uniref:Uncharacterized protein n=1 Tax=Eumeta variegata TaxID=151549 RepID=A0A4C2A5B6_EUMVA|nr:hypothetical protein EVAR_99846_1 [Eumeta japonica]